jgi:cyclic beta-1,2-glucan synthetase
MYRAGLEVVLGLRWRGDGFCLDPCLPRDWPGFSLTLRRGGARYAVEVQNPRAVSRGVQSVTLDGQPVAGGWVPLVYDGKVHQVVVVMG